MKSFKHATLVIICLLTGGCGCENGPTETIQISGQTFILDVASDEQENILWRLWIIEYLV